jgi:F-type H+-transporting ATPase subunit gamma
MPSLKDLRNRIRSVRSTQKITSAMKMVAASRLRRAQEQAEAARPYAERMERMLGSLAQSLRGMPNAPRLLAGTGSDNAHLIVVAGSDRGLAGGFNASILREARRTIRSAAGSGKEVRLITVGRKPRDSLRRDHQRLIVESLTDIGRPRLTFEGAQTIARGLIARFEAGEFDRATIIYNRFRSAMTQIVTQQALIPFAPPETAPQAAAGAVYEFEPDETEILADLLPRALAVQLYAALLENAASEQGARMTAMDNATRNAGEMIDKLTITYNRTRQASITKELIEIISGAEAL